MASSVALSLSVESDPLLLLVSRVRDHAEILGVLCRLAEPAALAGFVVDGFRGGGFVTRIRTIDPVARTFRLEAPSDARRRARMREGGHGTLVGVVDDTRVQFTAAPFEADGDSSWLAVRIPPMIHRLPRRLAHRARLALPPAERSPGAGAAAHARVSLATDAPALPVQDLSIGGLSLRVPPTGPRLRVGDVLPRCRIALGGSPPLTADLWVRHLRPGIRDDEPSTVGCVLGVLSADDERQLRRWLFAIQRGG